jgi:hypothetical protein
MNRKNSIVGSLCLLTLSSIGCGGSNKSSVAASAMTQTQAAAAYSDVFAAMADAEGALLLDRSTPVSMLHKQQESMIQKAILNGVLIPTPAEAIAPSVAASPDATTPIPAYTYACPSGGTIVVTGSYSMTPTSDSASVVETIKNCQQSGVTMNGDPDIALSITGSDNGTATTVTMIMSGGLTVGASSCTTDLNFTATVTDKTLHGSATYTGTFCDVALNGSESF